MSERLLDKVAVVTGGASGIGEGIVRRFCREGARVLLADLDEVGGTAIADECGAQFVALDVTSEESWQALESKIRVDFGCLDIMVNNAGIVSNLDITAVTVEAWQRLMSVNLTGVMLGCQTAISLMRDNPAGPGDQSSIRLHQPPILRFLMSLTRRLKRAWWASPSRLRCTAPTRGSIFAATQSIRERRSPLF